MCMTYLRDSPTHVLRQELIFGAAIRDTLLHNPPRIVDLACGRGGDIGRFARAIGKPFDYVGIDVSANQISAARIREKNGDWPAATRWAVADAFGPETISAIASMGCGSQFDVVSIQMALHYAAESEARMASAIDNAAALCKPGAAVVVLLKYRS